MFRRCAGEVQVLLVHPGGPYFINKDDGTWSVPKGEPNVDEDLLTAATREFHEETGFNATAPFIELKPVKQKGGKVVHAWAFEGDCDLKPFTTEVRPVELETASCLRTDGPHRACSDEISIRHYFCFVAVFSRNRRQLGRRGIHHSHGRRHASHWHRCHWRRNDRHDDHRQ